jgi:hypothetical protein
MVTLAANVREFAVQKGISLNKLADLPLSAPDHAMTFRGPDAPALVHAPTPTGYGVRSPRRRLSR